jgi:hypothetical protein
MSKKHKKKARSARIKPHTVKEANRRKQLREHLKAKRQSTKAKQCSKTGSGESGGTGCEATKNNEEWTEVSKTPREKNADSKTKTQEMTTAE